MNRITNDRSQDAVEECPEDEYSTIVRNGWQERTRKYETSPQTAWVHFGDLFWGGVCNLIVGEMYWGK